MNSVAFCTCNDRKCPFNPVNHDKGCTPCIAKNLHEHEIPTCLFNAISPDRPIKTSGRGKRSRDM